MAVTEPAVLSEPAVIVPAVVTLPAAVIEPVDVIPPLVNMPVTLTPWAVKEPPDSKLATDAEPVAVRTPVLSAPEVNSDVIVAVLTTTLTQTVCQPY